MATKVAINGFGRIGRLVARAILERDDHDLELVSINDLADTKSNALLFQYDSTHGRFPGTVETGENTITVNGKTIQVTSERDPGNLPHGEQGIDIVLECTGFFQSHEQAEYLHRRYRRDGQRREGHGGGERCERDGRGQTLCRPAAAWCSGPGSGDSARRTRSGYGCYPRPRWA